MANDENIDRIINRNWRVVRKIGQGGMGTVWEVRHKDIRRMRSAVKEIKAGLTNNQEVVRRFLREVRLMAELEGVDHIVRVTEFDRQEGIVFMTLVDGPSLAQVIERQGALPYEQVVRFGAQIATALGIVHERGIVHRDIKPPNILIDEKHQKAYLTDFGIAKKLDLSEGDETIDGTLTLEGTLTVDVQYMGTPRYSSPEQLRVEYPPHALWDIYAMGVLLYEAYSGLRYLPQFRKYHEFLQSIGTNPAFPSALQYPTPPPPSFGQLVEHCLQRDPAQRLQSAAEMAARLAECEAELRRTGVVPGSRRPTESTLEDQETLREDFRDPRRDLREEIEHRFGTLEEIEGTLVAVGLNLPLGPASETLGHALRDISIIEGEGQFQEALGRLEALREQAAAAHSRAEQAAREGLERRVEEIAGARRDLAQRAGRWLDDALVAPVDEALIAARRGLAEARWKQVGDGLAGVPEGLHAAGDAARRTAQTSAAALLAEITDQVAALQRLDAAAMPRGVELPALRAQVEAQLADGQLETAVQQADAARATIAAALDRARAAAAEQLRAERVALERQLDDLDVAAARSAAPGVMDDVERARAAGATAAAAGDVVAALAAYTDARRAAGSAAAQVASAQTAERRRLAEALRVLAAETANAPPEVVDEARTAALAVLERPPAAHAAAVVALTEASARLTAARDALPAFAAATALRAAAEAARAASAGLSLPRADRRRADAALSAAADAFERRAWAEAATRYGEAQQLWESLAAGARQRSQQEECAALRTALLDELEGLAGLEAERAALALPADDTPAATVLHGALEPLSAREREGAFGDAIAGLTALRERAGQARAAHGTALHGAFAAAVTALGERRDALATRTGTLLTPAHRTEMERAAAGVAAAARTGAWAEARRARADAEQVLERIETELRGAVADTLRERLAALEAGLEGLAALEAPLPEVDAKAVATRAMAQLEGGQLAAALQTVDETAGAVAAARAAREHELAEQLRALRATVETNRRGLDVNAARAAAPADLEAAERLSREASVAEQHNRYLDAIRAYEAAGAALAAAARALDQRQRAELAELAAAVREGLERAEALPAALAAPAQQAARAALGEVAAADRAAARQALQAARAGLDATLADAPAFAAAETHRAAAQRAQHQLVQLPVVAEEQEAAQHALDTGATALARRAWAEARDRFANAEGAFEELVRVGEERQRVARELAAQREAARGALAALIERAQAAPGEVVGETLRAAEALLGAAEPALEDLSAAESALAQALDAVPAYHAALEQRAAADARQALVAKRRLPRRQLKAPRARLRAAAVALGRREWAAAAERYAEAAELFAALEVVPAPKPARWPYAAAAVLLLAAAAVPIARWLASRETRVSVATAPAAPRPAQPAQPSVGPQAVQPPVIPPPVPPVPLAHIASAEPAATEVRVDEGAAQKFAIQLADASADTDIEWLFGGKPLADARGKTAWDYRPDFTASAGSPYDVTVKVGGGTADGQARSWRVDVADQNRLPQILKVLPPQNQEIKKEIGQTASLAVEASDADGDALTYQWTVDGKPVGGNKPALDVPVERDRETVALAISDGKQPEPLHLEWKLSGSESPWIAQPSTLKQLAFGTSETFKLTPPAGTAPAGIQIAWAVNGHKVADGPTFSYQATDPDLVGPGPVQVRASASVPNGKPFAKEWSFTLTPPPPPKLAGTSPPTGTVTAAAGAAQTLALTAAPPANGQRFTYVFDVNGKPTTSTTPSISVTPSDSGDTVVVAAIEDNFKQRSKESRWTIRPPAKPVIPEAAPLDAAALVRRWLDQYRGALNGKDVATQCSLLELDAGKCAQLTKALETQGNLSVAFDNVAVEPLSDGRLRARYTRVDDFVDPSGHSQSRTTSVTQTFRLANGKAQLDKSAQ